MNMNLEFAAEVRELTGQPVPETPNKATGTPESNKIHNSKGENNQFSTHAICTHLSPITTGTFREGQRVSMIVYKNDGTEWKTHMMCSIQTGVPDFGPLGDLEFNTIGENDDSPETVIKLDATLYPSENPDEDSPVLGEINVRAGRTSLPNF